MYETNLEEFSDVETVVADLYVKKVELPKEAIIYDLKGKHIYPAFIDLYSDYGIIEPKKTEYSDSPKKGAYGNNQAIKSEIDDGFLLKLSDLITAEASL
jgi:imidazolonepropionase-like amidohydrolase